MVRLNDMKIHLLIIVYIFFYFYYFIFTIIAKNNSKCFIFNILIRRLLHLQINLDKKLWNHRFSKYRIKNRTRQMELAFRWSSDRGEQTANIHFRSPFSFHPRHDSLGPEIAALGKIRVKPRDDRVRTPTTSNHFPPPLPFQPLFLVKPSLLRIKNKVAKFFFFLYIIFNDKETLSTAYKYYL